MPGKPRRKSTSKAQQEAMAIAEHDPGKLYKRNRGLLKMTHAQLHEFAATKRRGLPERRGKGRRRRVAVHHSERMSDYMGYGMKRKSA